MKPDKNNFYFSYMKKSQIALIVLILSSCVNQSSYNQEAIRHQITTKETKEILYALANDDMKGRDSNSGGYFKAASYVTEYFKKHNVASFYESYKDSLVTDSIVSYNVVGQIGKYNPKRKTILIGAHLDHVGIQNIEGDNVFNGANDNAAGSTAVMQISRFLAQHSWEKNIIIALFADEEKGLKGAHHLADRLKEENVDLAYMISDHIGYIKLDRFARNSYDEFTAALRKLTSLGMDDLVLDLRGNGGGFIDIATSIVDEFHGEDALIVFTKNNKGSIEEYYATENGAFEKGKLYVLIDENSASASEIVAGALQDNDKGTIIGRRSFGKGLVQVEMGLGDGSAVRLTTARYYTPTGRSIQKPYAKNGDINYRKDYQKRIMSGELLYRDSIQINDSLRYTTPKGKYVYGGGGIIPDIFVGIDTTGYLSNFFLRSITNFSFDYVDKNRKLLNDNWTLDLFLDNFDKNNSVFESYLTKISDIGSLSYSTKEKINSYVKATIAREIFGDEGFYRSIQKDDAMLQKVLELDSSTE